MNLVEAITAVAQTVPGPGYLGWTPEDERRRKVAITYLEQFEEALTKLKVKVDGICEVNNLWDGS